MIALQLSLRHSPAPLRPASAWLIPGDHPAAWIDEMSAWSVPLGDARLYVLPKSIRDPRPACVLVTLGRQHPRTVRRALPYGQIAGKLFLPVAAALYPPAHEEELAARLLWDVQVLRPPGDLVGFKRDDALRVHDLIAPPSRRQTTWDRAVPGIALAAKLLSVELQNPPTLDDLFSQARDDIASESPDELPPEPGESALRDAMHKAGVPLARAMKWIAEHGLSGAAGGKMSERAGEKIARWSAAVQKLRDRELNRLLGLLERDPDEGLQYAIPLRDVPTRGTAPPGWQLPRRPVIFDLGRLFGGARAAGDSWIIQHDLHQKLTEKYRAAANRELNLGRCRRAAYIFAELLGDHAAAAAALRDGRFFRDAAAIFEKRLNNLHAAADCLERGGLLLEAVGIYERMQSFVKAGDLYAKLERPDEAERCYRLAVQQQLDRAHVIGAAELLETKLHVVDEALDLLRGAWPFAAEAGPCLKAWFQLSGRANRHDAAARRVDALVADDTPEHRVIALAEGLSATATSYPNPQIRAAAADATRVVAGRRLREIRESTERRALVHSVAALDQDDRLLQRDATRFLTRRAATPQPIPVKSISPTLVKKFKLPQGLDWRCVVAIGDIFYAIGTHGRLPMLVRGTWSGTIDLGHFLQTPPTDDEQAFAMMPLSYGRTLLVLRLRPSAAVDELTIGPGAYFPGAVLVGTPAFLRSAGAHGACLDERGIVTTLCGLDANYATLSSSHAVGGELVSTQHICLTPAQFQPLVGPVPMIARKGNIWIGWGDQLIRVKDDATIERETLPRPIVSLTASAPHTIVRIVATFDEGAALIREGGSYQPFGDGLFDPVAAFTAGGTLVLVARGRGHLYDTRNAQATFRASFDDVGNLPIAVTSSGADGFAIFDATGEVRVYRLPG